MLLSRSFVAALAMLGAGSAVASTAVSVKITGKIVPPVCDVSLTMPTVELGNVQLEDSGTFSDLEVPFGSMGISCSAKTYVRVSVGGTMPDKGFSSISGLGGWSQKGVALSDLTILTKEGVINGLPGEVVLVDRSTQKVHTPYNVIIASRSPDNYSTFMLKGGNTVEAVKTASFDLIGRYPHFVVNDHSSAVTADQTLTFEVNYL